jgi:hypothetical protein
MIGSAAPRVVRRPTAVGGLVAVLGLLWLAPAPLAQVSFMSRSERIWGGTSQIQRDIVGRAGSGPPEGPKPAWCTQPKGGRMPLSDYPLHASIAVSDIQQAVAFYEGKLGLPAL